MSRYAPARQQQPRAPRVDREKTCPSLLRVFVNSATHHPDSAFTVQSVPTAHEFQIYVWRDSTLKEVVLGLRDAAPHLRSNSAAKFSLRLVFWDSKLEKYTSKDLAHVNAKDLGSAPADGRRPGGVGVGGGSAIDKTLSDAKYVIGDFIDIAYIVPGLPPPHAGGPVAHPHGPGNGPQFAPVAAPNGPRGGPGAFGARGPPGGGPLRNGPRGDTWAPTTRPGHNGPMSRGGGGGPSGRPAPADQGWGPRRPRGNAPEERMAPNGSRSARRSSRSLSPVHTRQPRPRHHSPSRPRSRSPPPHRARSRSFSAGPDRARPVRDRSGSPNGRRATPPHMKGRDRNGKRDEEDMNMD